MQTSNYDIWYDQHINKKIYNLKKYLTLYDFKILKKLDITLVQMTVSGHELERVYEKILNYYNDDGKIDYDLLKSKNVKANDYHNLVKRIEILMDDMYIKI